MDQRPCSLYKSHVGKEDQECKQRVSFANRLVYLPCIFNLHQNSKASRNEKKMNLSSKNTWSVTVSDRRYRMLSLCERKLLIALRKAMPKILLFSYVKTILKNRSFDALTNAR